VDQAFRAAIFHVGFENLFDERYATLILDAALSGDRAISGRERPVERVLKSS